MKARGARSGRTRRRSWPAIMVSVGVHSLILAAIGLIVPHPAFRNYSPDEKAITMSLAPPPELRRVNPRLSQLSNSSPKPAAQILTAPRLHIPLHAPIAIAPSLLSAPPASQPGPLAAAPKPGTGLAPGPLPANETPRGLSAMLRRSVGCDYAEVVHLTPEEKEACAKRFGDMARKAEPFSGVPDDKRGGFSLQAASDERRRAAREGPTASPIHACEGPGSNFGVGCLNEDYKTKIRVP